MPFGLSLSSVKLIGLTLIVLAFVALFGLWRFAVSEEKRWQAVAQTYAAQRDEAIAANTGLTNQVVSLTSDKAKADAAAAAARRLLEQRDQQVTQTITKVEEKIREVAIASDKVCSPALAAALGVQCPGTSTNDHPPASDRKAAP